MVVVPLRPSANALDADTKPAGYGSKGLAG
jgi:hypothetical protein